MDFDETFVETTEWYEKEYKTLVVRSKDLKLNKEDIDLLDISLDDLKCSLRLAYEASFVIFIDDGGFTKIMKNRYGDRGIVVTKREYIDYKRLLEKESKEKLKDEKNKISNTKNNKNIFEKTTLLLKKYFK